MKKKIKAKSATETKVEDLIDLQRFANEDISRIRKSTNTIDIKLETLKQHFNSLCEVNSQLLKYVQTSTDIAAVNDKSINGQLTALYNIIHMVDFNLREKDKKSWFGKAWDKLKRKLED